MRALIAAASREVRSALELLLTEGAHIEVVGSAGQGGALARAARSLRPDVIVADCRLVDSAARHGRSGAARLMRAVRRASPGTRVVLLGTTSGCEAEAAIAGADAFVDAGDPPEAVLAAAAGPLPGERATAGLDAHVDPRVGSRTRTKSSAGTSKPYERRALTSRNNERGI